MFWWVYVLRCADGSLYVGMSQDLHRRLAEHQAGKVAWTRGRLPVQPIHTEQFPTRGQARRREKYLKGGSGKEWLKACFAPGGP